MNFKKLLAITLVLAMVLSFMPTFAFADDEIVTEEPASEAAAEEPVVEEEPEAPQEEPETWDTSEELLPEEPVEEPEVGAGVFVTFRADGTSVAELQATAASETGKYYMDADSLATAEAAAKAAHPGYPFLRWQESGVDVQLDSAHPFTPPTSGKNKTVDAVFSTTPETYAVTYAAEGLTGATLPAAETVNYNSNAKVLKSDGTQFTVVTPSGYNFVGFVLAGTTYTIDQIRTADATKITGATTITLKWEPTTTGPHTVIFDYTGATQASIVGSQYELNKVKVTVNHGETIPTSAYNANPTSEKAADHVSFKKWNSSVSTLEVTSAITQDVTFTADWQTEEFTVSYEGYPDKSESVPYNGHAKGFTPSETPDHQQFVGWSLTSGGTEAVSLATYPITKATTFYPIFTAQPVKVTFYYVPQGSAGTSAVQFAEQTVAYGGKATNPGDPELFGYHVDKWTTDTAGEKAFSFDTAITADETKVYAWEKGNKYTLEIDTTGITGDVYYGTTATGADKPLSNPVATIEVYGGNDGTSFAKVLLIKSKSYNFKNGYTYKVYNEATKKVEDASFKPEAAGTDLALNKNMQFAAGTAANEYKLVLTPKDPEKTWTVDFVSKYGTNAIGVGDQFKAPASFAVAQTATRRITEDDLKGAGTDVKLKEGVIADQNLIKSKDGKDYFLEGWYTDAAFTTKYDFNAYVSGSMTLYAKWVPFQTLTFNLTQANTEFKSPDDPAVKTTKRIVLNGNTLAEMEALANKYADLASYLTAKGNVNYKLPVATRTSYNTLKWLDGKTEFTAATKVTADVTLTDSWSNTTCTVKFDTQGGKPEIADVTVNNGETVSKVADVTKDGYAFDKWEFTPSGATKAEEFVFGTTKVTENITVVAKWKAAEAKIGTVYYEKLSDAVAVADGKTVELVTDIEKPAVTVKGNVTFKFGDKTVTGGTFTVETGKTLTVESGTFSGVTFDGAGTVAIKGGIFVDATSFGDAVANPTVTVTDGKFDASVARPVNKANKLGTGKMLAVTAASTDGYYRCVASKTLSLNFVYAVKDDNKTPVVTGTTLSLPIGVGETPAHAIKEYLEVNKATSDPITSPTKATSVTANVRFDKWLKGDASSTTALDLNAVCSDNITATANWMQQFKVSFFVYNDPWATTPVAEYSVNVDKDAKVTAWDASEVIAKHNKDQGPTKQDEFEYWEDTATGKAFDFANTKVTAPISLWAIKKCRVVFDYQDQTTAPVVIQVNNGDRLSKYTSQIPAGSWVNESGSLVNPNEIIRYDRTYVPLSVDNKDWNLIEYSPEKGLAYSYDPATATGTGTYKGTAAEPIVISAYSSDSVWVSFRIEAPATVKSYDDFQVSVDNAEWKNGSYYSGGRSANQNYTYYVSEPLTVQQIKDAAKAGKTFEFTFKFRPAPTEANKNPDVAASFKFTFDPANLKLTNYTSNPKNPSKVLLIKDGKYEYKLTYKLNGGTSVDAAAVVNPVEYGEQVILANNPALAGSMFYRWVGSDGSVYNGGYKDKDGTWTAEGKDFGGKKYGGAWVETGEWRNNFIMTQDVTFEAEYTTDPAIVQITDNGFVTTDGSFETGSLISEVAAKLPEPKEKTTQLFKEWKVRDYSKTTETWYPIKDVAKTVKIRDYAKTDASGKNATLYVEAVYYDPAVIMTFVNAGETALIVKQPTGTTAAAKFYNQSVKDVEASIDLFKYWTAEKPDDNGRWAKAPAEFDWAKATYAQADAGKVYAYVPYTEYTVKIHPAGGGVNEIKVEHGKTIPSKDLPVVEGQVGWSTVDPATAQPVDFPADTPIKADTEIWAYYQIFTVKYDANGGKDAPKDQIKVFGIDLELTKDEPTLIGREFLGWAKTATATEPEFKGGDKYKENKDVTLYAVWSEGEPVTEFVKRAYSLILGREADQEGLDYWVKGLQDKTFKGGDIVSQFMNSDEYVLANHPNAEAVTAVYKTMLDREPDAEGQAYWVGLLDEGASYNLIINGFCDSAEFKGICEQYDIEPGTVATERRDENLKVTGFVSRNYKCALNRSGDSFGLNYWAGQLLDKAQTPYQVAHGFVFSEECVGRNLNNTQFVTMLYKLYMDREPEADGLAYWVGQLDNKTMTREEVEKGFADSPEFAEIIKSYGL